MSEGKTDLAKFDSEVRPLVRGDILHMPPDHMPIEAAVKAFALIKHMAEILEKRKQELRTFLLDNKSILKHAEKVGKGGSTKTMVEGNKVNRKRTEKHLANIKKLKEILEEKSIPSEEVFDTVTRTITETVVNPSKIEALVQTGRLTEAEVKSCNVITWTFTVNPSAEVKDLLEEFDRRNLEVRRVLQEAAEAEED